MASFSNDVKKELVSGINDKNKQYACLYGILLFCRNISDNNISFTTESKEFSELFTQLVKDICGSYIQVDIETNQKKNGINVYSVSLNNNDVLRKFYIDCDNIHIDRSQISEDSISAFLSGVFFICGSLSDPYKEYHLEFTMNSDKLYSDLHSMLLSIGIDGRKTTRKGSTILYIKDSENIEDVLTFIGACQSTIDIMNIKIYKDVRNKANRIANCDSANIDKVIAAALKQTEDIQLIIANDKFESLSSELRETAELRLENPEMTLQEIGELLTKPIGRSGVMRRFKRLSAIAEQIKQSN